MNIDLELYRIFYTVAKYKNISKATEELYISQPAITQRINNLEMQLNIKLFYRRPDGMQLTMEGKELFNYVKDSIEVMNNVENKFNGYLQKNRSNNIKMKTTNQIDNLILCNTIVELNGQVDIITIRDIVKTKNKNLQIVATKKLTPCLYTSRKYLEKYDKKIDLLHKSEQYNFILPKQDTLERKEFDKFCRKHHLNIQYKYETQSINIRKYFVLNGLGIAVGFKEYIQEELKKKIFVEIPLEGSLPECDINWVTLNNERKKDEIIKLIEIVKEG